jgi:hypothetical protein
MLGFLTKDSIGPWFSTFRLEAMKYGPILYRIPLFTLAIVFAVLYWAYPSQLDDVLFAAQAAPAPLLVGTFSILVMIGLTHFALLTSKDRLNTWVDPIVASLPSIALWMCMAKATQDAIWVTTSLAFCAVASMFLLARLISRDQKS